MKKLECFFLMFLLIALSIAGCQKSQPSNDRKKTSESPMAGESEKVSNQDQLILNSLKLPLDTTRSSVETYYKRIIIRNSDGQPFLIGYWRSGGSFLEEAIDIFAIGKTAEQYNAKRVYSDILGGPATSFSLFDVDGDHQEDLIVLHETGGQIVTRGITILNKTKEGFSKMYDYAGHDIWIYKEQGQVRFMVKESGIGQIQEFGWDRTKKKITSIRTVQLILNKYGITSKE